MSAPTIGLLHRHPAPIVLARGGRTYRDHSTVSSRGTQIRALCDIALAEACERRGWQDDAESTRNAPVFGTIGWA